MRQFPGDVPEPPPFRTLGASPGSFPGASGAPSRGVPGLVRDLFVPPRCPACGGEGRDALCPGCLRRADRLVLPAQGLTDLGPGVVAVAAFAYDGPIREALRAVKAGGHHAAVPALGALLRERLPLPSPGGGVAWTWVPSTRKRLRERGVDLARLLAGSGAVPLLRRSAERPDQTDLSAAERRASPAGSFAPLRAVPPAVVLVDDVRTTGATATAAASALLDGGAARVVVATLAASPLM